MNQPAIFLVDNGSLRPGATFALRDLADRLSARTGQKVEAVSLLHSHKIPAEKLDGTPATIVKRRMRELFQEGQREFIILPLFLGPSLAITDYLPGVVEDLRHEQAGLSVKIAHPIAGANVEHPDARLAEILQDHVNALGNPGECELALVDHGTPIRPVNTLRNTVAGQLAELMGQAVQPCSMERREGPECAFNDPLLENLGVPERSGPRRLVLAMFFLLPGRHAGEGGDVAEIAENLVRSGAYTSVDSTRLLAEHPRLLDILSDRLAQVRG
jgi:sirohydrochlorin ferrochelatase